MDWDILFRLIASVLGVLLTAYVIPVLKSKISADAQENVLELVSEAVNAAEQKFEGSGRGTEKKAWVIAWLAGKGISVDEDTIDAFIESAVYVLNEAKKAL